MASNAFAILPCPPPPPAGHTEWGPRWASEERCAASACWMGAPAVHMCMHAAASPPVRGESARGARRRARGGVPQATVPLWPSVRVIQTVMDTMEPCNVDGATTCWTYAPAAAAAAYWAPPAGRLGVSMKPCLRPSKPARSSLFSRCGEGSAGGEERAGLHDGAGVQSCRALLPRAQAALAARPSGLSRPFGHNWHSWHSTAVHDPPFASSCPAWP